MQLKQKLFTALTAAAMLVTAVPLTGSVPTVNTTTAAAAADTMEWGTLGISGGGFVSGIITGKEVMYARTDVGGAYKYNYETKRWDQLMSYVSEADRGYLSVDAIAIDPNNDDNVYMLCGCAYFSDARTAIFCSTDGGKSFVERDVTDLIQVHGNGYGRQCGESIAVDPDDPKTIYCGGDTVGLIVSHDAGATWALVDSYNELGLFTEEIKWPTWTEHIVKTTGKEYFEANGVSTIAISGGKVIVGASVVGMTNVYMADVGKDNWEPLHADLPTSLYPSRINLDADGNLLLSYVPTLTFGSSGGGAWRYDMKTGALTDISPAENLPFGAVVSDPDDAKTLVATTCGVWNAQLWNKDDWTNDCVSWGDVIYRSTDGGTTWEQMSPGKEKHWEGPLQADYLQDGGKSWIRNKAIHWSGAVVLDPMDDQRLLVTSGNGVFACDNVWDELPQLYFHADGIEEVVSLDLVSVPGGKVYSAIGDYDGFIHETVTESTQYQPNMGSTSAIAYCPSNPDVMFRCSMNNSTAYYSMDAGKTWVQTTASGSGGKAAITQLKDGTYRFLYTNGNSVSYSDDFGKTWTAGAGTTGGYVTVDPEKPNYLYSAGNDNNPYEPNWKASSFLYVSADYGATWEKKRIGDYDKYEDYSRVTAIGNGTVYCCAGFNGLYKTEDYGETFTKIDGLAFCTAVGKGIGKTEDSPLAIYAWACETEDGNYGIFRSEDEGKTWSRVNDDLHSYGGTGNGKYIVGDMNTYGTVYMSTVGMGIVYGRIATGTNPPQTTTTTKKPDVTTLYGDVNNDGIVSIADVVLLARYISQDSEAKVSAEGIRNADCAKDDELNAQDVSKLSRFLVGLVSVAEMGAK